MGLMRRRRVKPPIKVYGLAALSTVTVELSGSWEMSYVGNVQEQRMGPTYRWTPQLTSTTRQALVHVLNHNIEGVKVAGGSGSTIELHAAGKVSKQALDQLRTTIQQAEAMSIAEARPVAV